MTKIAGFLLALVALPSIVWLIVPTRARSDRMLFAILILAAGFIVGGADSLLLGEPGSSAYLICGFLSILYARTRWRAAMVTESPVPEA